MAGFAELLSKQINALQKDIQKAQETAMREALKEGAKTYKEIAKPLIPVLGKSTETRQKGTVKNNLRHRIRVKKNSSGGLTGKLTLRIRRAGGKKMAPVSANTKDKTDPFYWFMLDRGTKKMRGSHFMARAKSAGEDKTISKVKGVYLQKMYQEMKRWR
ncbi:hypothetical protein F9854_03370 [Glaesserella parasuis]|uniref:HK97-gp10 family putative phage morphogenesis protein n=1 Tax=Glaesserella parasuis TaxID=738 RepID=UPI001354A3F9|nr:HK97-gp10 family putative phage morphogenesis protein [Glaesserella parasuis]MDG6267158.1 hypothetical protein [Glaesserella parasuis]MDG6296377.1 hypothetical protein [Glaesserella parasuis]MWQ86546.1 hypothetical protein [Glaesserella parasuis]